jgi:hypothetical protein
MPLDLHSVSAAGWTDPSDTGVRIRPMDAPHDVPLLHRWITQPYAAFWGMQAQSLAETRAVYDALLDSGHAHAFIGRVDGRRAFLVECYDPASDALAEHYAVRTGDLGMHFLVGPPEVPVSGFTRRVFRSIMNFMFDRLRAQRIVVEPDVRNRKVQVLNEAMGFVHERDIDLAHKRAGLAFCTQAAFRLAVHQETAE